MSDPAAGSTARGPASAPPPRRRGGLGALAVLLPAVTFLVGLLIGFGIWGASRDAEGTGVAGAGPSAEATPDGTQGSDPDEGTGDGTVSARVPEECLAAVTESQRSIDLVEEAVTAIGEFDATRLQRIVDELQSSSGRVGSLSEDCRAQADVSAGTSGSAPPS